MLNISRTGILTRCLAATCIACLAVAAASTVRANEDQNKSDQQKQNQQNQQQAQPNQKTGAQLKAPANAPNQKNQQANEQNQPNEQQTAEQQNTNQQQASPNESNRAESANERQWPAPQRYEYRSDKAGGQAQQGAENGQQARGQQGASLGINIVNSENGQGVTVMRIMPNTAAQKMGLRRRDRITSLNGQPVRSVDQFISDIRDMQPGQQVALSIVRNGNQRTVRGELQGYSESIVQTQGPSGTREYRSFQGVITPNQGNEYSSDEGQMNENRQAGYEENGEPSEARSGDFGARLSRLEQQIDRLSQQVDQLREAVGPTRLSERPGNVQERTDANAAQPQQQFRDSQQETTSQPNPQQNPKQ
ncbi:MAG TPA: PDZ domain-containing protein [Lacipirellulaceae bacterium]|nr:PDZ domain-containing protein [Lacipirellulaceae bacterium]